MEQGIELAGGEQLIESAPTVEHALLDLALDALVLEDQQAGAVAVGLGAERTNRGPTLLSQ
jgi:hypothetical protein